VRRSRFAHLALVTAFGATPLIAQPAPGLRSVEGRVVVQRDTAAVPVAGTWVTVHRVARDSAGPLDSTRTDARGAYVLRYRPFGADDAIYFVSTRYGGVAYFTSPLREPVVKGESAEISVFDTTTAPVPMTVRGRHLIVSAPDTRGAREVIEVYEISNDSSVTRLDREGASGGTWSAPLPAAARDFRVREGEVPVDALVLAGSRAVLHMPFAPGLKQIAFSYSLAPERFPLAIAPERNTSVFEVLVEDPHATVQGPRMAAVDPVLVEGRSFRRFLGQDVPAGARIVVDAPAPQPEWTRWIVPALLALLGLAMVSALALPRRRRALLTPTSAPRAPEPAIDTDAAQLAQRIASLDDAFEREPTPSADARESYERTRAALKSELSDALARVGAPH
jgi:hypothetical protein